MKRIDFSKVQLTPQVLIQSAILLFLFGNLIIMLGLMNKVDHLLERNRLGNGGFQNLSRLANLYQKAEYQSYFSGEITQLEAKIAQFSSQHETQ